MERRIDFPVLKSDLVPLLLIELRILKAFFRLLFDVTKPHFIQIVGHFVVRIVIKIFTDGMALDRFQRLVNFGWVSGNKLMIK